MKANVYVGAPCPRGWGKLQRRVTVQLVNGDGTSEDILDVWIDAPVTTPDSCYVIEGSVTYRDAA